MFIVSETHKNIQGFILVALRCYCCSFEQCMHKVSRVETEDISLVDVRLGRLHSCLQSSISTLKYCDAHHKWHVLLLCETMQVASRH